MNIVDIFVNNPYFHKKSLQVNEVVFDEGMQDSNIYIVISGKFSIEKYTTVDKSEVKELSLLSMGDVFGEGALSGKTLKEVRIRAISNGEIYVLDTKEDLQKFVMEYPKESFTLLEHIIQLTNTRLLFANREITVNYELQRSIAYLDMVDLKHMFIVFDKLKNIFGCDYIIYIEKSTLIEHMIVIRYDTREVGKAQDMVIKFPDDFKQDVLEKNGINLRNYTIVQKLKIGNEELGYLVFGNSERPFDEVDRRISQSIANGIVSLMKQEKILKEERNKNYLKNHI